MNGIGSGFAQPWRRHHPSGGRSRRRGRARRFRPTEAEGLKSARCGRSGRARRRLYYGVEGRARPPIRLVDGRPPPRRGPLDVVRDPPAIGPPLPPDPPRLGRPGRGREGLRRAGLRRRPSRRLRAGESGDSVVVRCLPTAIGQGAEPGREPTGPAGPPEVAEAGAVRCRAESRPPSPARPGQEGGRCALLEAIPGQARPRRRRSAEAGRPKDLAILAEFAEGVDMGLAATPPAAADGDRPPFLDGGWSCSTRDGCSAESRCRLPAGSRLRRRTPWPRRASRGSPTSPRLAAHEEEDAFYAPAREDSATSSSFLGIDGNAEATVSPTSTSRSRGSGPRTTTWARSPSRTARRLATSSPTTTVRPCSASR